MSFLLATGPIKGSPFDLVDFLIFLGVVIAVTAGGFIMKFGKGKFKK